MKALTGFRTRRLLCGCAVDRTIPWLLSKERSKRGTPVAIVQHRSARWVAFTSCILLFSGESMAGTGGGMFQSFLVLIGMFFTTVLGIFSLLALACWLFVRLLRQRKWLWFGVSLVCSAIPFILLSFSRNEIVKDFHARCDSLRDLAPSGPRREGVVSVLLVRRYSMVGIDDGGFKVDVEDINGPDAFPYVETFRNGRNDFSVWRSHDTQRQSLDYPTSELALDVSTWPVARSDVRRIDGSQLSVIDRSTGELLASRVILMVRPVRSPWETIVASIVPAFSRSPQREICGSDFRIVGSGSSLRRPLGQVALKLLLTVAAPAPWSAPARPVEDTTAVSPEAVEATVSRERSGVGRAELFQ